MYFHSKTFYMHAPNDIMKSETSCLLQSCTTTILMHFSMSERSDLTKEEHFDNVVPTVLTFINGKVFF